MQSLKQIDCFSIHIKFWHFLGIWPGENPGPYYPVYSKFILIFLVFLYVFVNTINIYFIPLHLDVFIEEMLLYFTEIANMCKVMTFYYLSDEIKKLLTILESDIFHPTTEHGIDILNKAKVFIRRYWMIVAGLSLTSHISHVIIPIKDHLLYSEPLILPMSGYFFLSEQLKETYVFPLFLYQCVGMHCIVWYTINIDTFILGIIILAIAQLEILDMKLRTITDNISDTDTSVRKRKIETEDEYLLRLHECIVHYTKLHKYCALIQRIFSAALFVQFSNASCLICVCLFRFTLPAPGVYYIFLATYICIMTFQIMVPCWFGTRVMDKSRLLPLAVYNCDWTPRSRRFKSSLRIFAERTSRPLAITAGKMFPISLTTFTSIMNTAYSFFMLLRHMQSRET